MVVGTERCWVCTDLKKRGSHTWGESRRVLELNRVHMGWVVCSAVSVVPLLC